MTLLKAVLLLSCALFALGLGTAEDAYALNGYTSVSKCDACYTLADFYQLAFAQANAVARPGSYVVVSDTYAHSAIV
jgi:hypothetical protein